MNKYSNKTKQELEALLPLAHQGVLLQHTWKAIGLATEADVRDREENFNLIQAELQRRDN